MVISFGMAQVLIRRIDDDAFERVRDRAREAGKPVEQFLREVVEAAGRPSREAALAKLAEIRKSAKPGYIDIPAAIREGRDDEEEYLAERAAMNET